MTIDRALSGDPFRIDQILCRDAAQSLARFAPAHQGGPWSDSTLLSQFIFKTLFVSICHQFNWDYLQNAMAGWLLPAPERMLPELASVRSTSIFHLLGGYSKPERIRPEQRARMLRVTAHHLIAMMEDGRIAKVLEGRRLDGPDGFYTLMKSIPAFAEDELEKKVRVLAHDLYREGIVTFSDPENLRPAVEYHILRLYLRSGRVYPVDDSVRDALRSQTLNPRGRLVRLLRLRVEEAMKLTAFYSGLDVATLNYIEWQIGRSVCIADPPAFCTRPPEDELPADIAPLCGSSCAYSVFCRSHTQPSYGWFHEPQFQKAIY